MRPKIICHMTSSIDGRLLIDRWLRPDTEAEHALVGSTYDSLGAKLGTEGWMVGRTTMEDFASVHRAALTSPIQICANLMLVTATGETWPWLSTFM